MGRIRHLKGDGDEAVEVHGRADHCDPAGARGRIEDRGCLPEARDQQRDVLQMEGQVRWARRVRGPSSEDFDRRERQAEEAAGRGDARQRHVEGSQFKKMVTPAARRQAVAHLCSSFEVSQRRACEVIGADRSAVRYRSLRPNDATIRARLRELASVRRRFGYRRLLLMIRSEGVLINHKKLRRLYAEERLQVRRRGGRKRALGTSRCLWACGANSMSEPESVYIGSGFSGIYSLASTKELAASLDDLRTAQNRLVQT